MPNRFLCQSPHSWTFTANYPPALGAPTAALIACNPSRAMTMTNTSPSANVRRVKFTPEAIEKIKELVSQGASREEIASLLGVTVGSLQVTCSRLGIRLRRKILHSGPTPHLRDPEGKVIAFQGSVGVAYEQKQKAEEVLPACSAKISNNNAASRQRSDY
jgi:hypothetical protein